MYWPERVLFFCFFSMRYAVFIDAWYLKKTLWNVIELPFEIDIWKMVELIQKIASKIAPWKELLRVYWYDGTIPWTQPKNEHTDIAKCQNVKIRLWQLRKNPEWSYRQKWVDGLIVTDIISLSQNRAISDAILISGDEDLCVWIVPSQNMGIRVHLLNVATTTNAVSPHLVEDSDTQTFFIEDKLKECIIIRKKEEDDEKLSLVIWLLSKEEITILSKCEPWKIPKDIDIKIVTFLWKYDNPVPESTKKYYRNKIIENINKKPPVREVFGSEAFSLGVQG